MAAACPLLVAQTIVHMAVNAMQPAVYVCELGGGGCVSWGVCVCELGCVCVRVGVCMCESWGVYV